MTGGIDIGKFFVGQSMDSSDLPIVANTSGTLAVELVSQGRIGRMAVIQDGIYTETELPDPGVGPRTVDPSDYDAKRFRPDFSARFGRPIFF